MMFRESKINENADEIAYFYRTFPFWAVAAFYAAERSFRLVEAEKAEEAGNKPKGADMRITRTKSTVFALIEAGAESKKTENGGDFDAVQNAFENSPELSDEIFSFLAAQINAA